MLEREGATMGTAIEQDPRAQHVPQGLRGPHLSAAIGVALLGGLGWAWFLKSTIDAETAG